MAIQIKHGDTVFTSVKDACSALNIGLNSVRRLALDKGISYQEAFDVLVLQKRVWPPEDIELLQRRFEKDGTNIPELLEKYSKDSIKGMARRRGLHLAVRGSPCCIGGTKMPFTDALELLGFTYNTASRLRKKFNLNDQQVIDRLLKMTRKRDDGAYERLVDCTTLPTDHYIHFEGKMWGPRKFCEQHPQWSFEMLYNLSRSRGLSMRQTFDYLQGVDGGLEVLGISPNCISFYSCNDLSSTTYAYNGTDGREYVSCCCGVCGRFLLLNTSVAFVHRHGDSCILFETPIS